MNSSLLLVSVFLFILSFLPSNAYAVTPAMPSQQYHACSDAGSSVRVDWNTVGGADKYWFRLDANPRSWNETCENPGDLCATVTESEITLEITPEVQYNWWVHAVNAQGEYSKGMDGRDIMCTIPRPYNIYTDCKEQNTELYMNWSSTFGRMPERYEVRLDAYPGTNESGTWSSDCNNLQAGDICASSIQNNIRIEIEPGVPYRMWMHSVSGSGWTEAIGDRNILCGRLPTPTATHTPVPEPVDDCSLFSRGDATCDGIITINDYACWKLNYLEQLESTPKTTTEVCKKIADFSNPEAGEEKNVTLLDYAIWFKNAEF